MNRSFVALSVAAGLLAAPSLARAGKCSAPYPPVVPAAGIGTEQQIEELRGDVQAFIAASDIYQSCISQAENDGMLASSVADGNVVKDQQQKEQVGAAFNAAVLAFRAKSPTK